MRESPLGRESGKRLAALMFTDLVGSVELQRTLGTEAYTRFVARHDAIFKECLDAVADAEILNETGDGFLVRFADPGDAVSTALRLQHRLGDEVCEGRRMQLRIGLNMGIITEMSEALRGEKRAVGMAINLAARVMDLGEPGQILMTRTVHDEARQFVREHPALDCVEASVSLELTWLAHGPYVFKGSDDAVEIYEVGVEGCAPLCAPLGGAKARRLGNASTTLRALATERPVEPVPLDVIRNSDVYINYAPVDDRPLSPGQSGWISLFHRNLETRIEQLSGEPIKVIQRPPFDEESAAEQLVEAVPGVKAMVSVISPPFVKSMGCVREAEAFWKSALEAGNLRLDDRTRLLKVVKTPIAEGDIPLSLADVFSELQSFDFYQVDPDTGRLWEFDETFGVEARRRYYERVYDLAYELCHILRAFQSGPMSRAARAKGKIVFLAETTGDLRVARDRLKRELVERGHTVLPDRPLPLSGPELATTVKDCASRCSVAVHLVGSLYGLVPEAAEHSVVELQNRIAARCLAERAGTFTRLIWLPRERKEAEPRQKEFIRQLVEDPLAQLGADLVEGSLEEFKEILLEELRPPEPAIPTPGAPGASEKPGPTRVYLICDRADEEAVEPLEDYLFDQGFEVTTPGFEGTESEVAALHRQNLVYCDAALIYYGAASKGWVETKLMDLQQAAGYGRKRPLLARIVYVAPPFDRRKERFRTHQAEFVRSEESWEPRLLSTFVEGIKTRSAASE